jgi:T4 RnlA family RNA ligase
MHYKFPEIRHIQDVLPAIEGRDEFIVAERDWGKVVNYLVVLPDTFPEVKTSGGSAGMRATADRIKAIRRECRGLLFYPDGRIMGRRLHKFFNVNERDETQLGRIDLTRPHVILDKLDGSMITPVYTDTGIRWGTKMGITGVSMQAEVYVANNRAYTDMAVKCLQENQTAIFEWCSRSQRIVVDYPEDRLVLTAVRDNITGEYLSYDQLETLGDYYKIPVVKTRAGTVSNMESLIDETRASEGIEGYVIRFDNGQMLKIKGDWYVRIHKTKDNLVHEKNVVDLLITEKMDDAKSFMLEDDRRRAEDFENKFWLGVAERVQHYDAYWQRVISSGVDRKGYAVSWMPQIRDSDPFAAQFVFGKFGGRNSREMVVEQIAKHTSTGPRLDTVRHLWGGHSWNYHWNSDN